MTPKTESIEDLKKKRKKWAKKVQPLVDTMLSNMVLLSHVPAPTFDEKDRAKLLIERFVEYGLPDPFIDSMNNVIAIKKAEKPKRRILLFTHMDHQYPATVDQNITITQDKATGAGIANDTAGLGTLISIPDILTSLSMKLESDIIFLATTRSHGRGDFAGLRYFLDNFEHPIDIALNIRGITIGRFDYFSLSRSRCDVTVHTETMSNKTWGKFGFSSAIMVINEIMTKLYSIPIPRQPKTVLNIGMINGGEAYSTISAEASINLEVLSEDDKITEQVIDQINDNCLDIGAKHGVEVNCDFFGRHYASGLTASHLLVKTATAIVKDMGYKPMLEYSNTEITVALSKGIPTLALGVTTGRASNSPKGYIDLEPLPQGLLQTALLIYAIDKGYCDDTTE